MARDNKPTGKNLPRAGYVVGRASFVKISSVEGIRFSGAMEKRAAMSAAKGLSPGESRKTIIDAYKRKG
ncbi:hypothetical protein NB311A_12439 [Nitrobacter sp. Nb-311A]|jgi:hypothetical protein|uniref:hypothetical protein n=1 Tax=Nitrobacter sp. Nb-311A TaxID=314253 RepID=UPI0000684C93|nr:hypothetical protein [Nitrobacter sp. Nb-311A]EAQ35630.1 hypothetical protein NB311A_12439 [Nitrobacter sp. Nb-311A]